MTTNTNDMSRTALIIAAARMMQLDTDDIIDVLTNLLDVDDDAYTNPSLRALHALMNALVTSDDDYDDLNLALRIALHVADDDDRALYLALEHPYVARDND